MLFYGGDSQVRRRATSGTETPCCTLFEICGGEDGNARAGCLPLLLPRPAGTNAGTNRRQRVGPQSSPTRFPAAHDGLALRRSAPERSPRVVCRSGRAAPPGRAAARPHSGLPRPTGAKHYNLGRVTTKNEAEQAWFSAFVRLVAPIDRPDAPREVIDAACKAMQRKTHPDAGGPDADVQEVQVAIREASADQATNQP